jgi:hypothetical protein
MIFPFWDKSKLFFMKKFLPALAIVLAIVATSPSSARAATQSAQTELSAPISNRNVTRLLKIAAQEWSMTLGAARQAYNAGEITLMPYPAGGPDTYMILYDGFCILAVLEDKL